MDARSYVEANARGFFDALKEWLAIPSISADPAHHADVRKSAEWLAAYLHKTGFPVAEIWETAGLPAVFAHWPAADPAAPRRRVVIAAELPDSASTGNNGFDEPALVQIAAPVALRDVVSAHVDDPSAASEIAAAIAALPAADAGDEDARFAVDGAEGYELQWYATQEIGDLLA